MVHTWWTDTEGASSLAPPNLTDSTPAASSPAPRGTPRPCRRRGQRDSVRSHPAGFRHGMPPWRNRDIAHGVSRQVVGERWPIVVPRSRPGCATVRSNGSSWASSRHNVLRWDSTAESLGTNTFLIVTTGRGLLEPKQLTSTGFTEHPRTRRHRTRDRGTRSRSAGPEGP